MPRLERIQIGSPPTADEFNRLQTSIERALATVAAGSTTSTSGAGGGGTGGDVDTSVSVITNLDVSRLVATNVFVYAGPLRTALPTDNMFPRSARVVGFWNGSQVLTGTSTITVKCTTDGGKPVVGAPLYLAGTIDDSGTGSGKVTATEPIIATPLNVPPSNWARSIVVVGTVLDNSLYDSQKTCVAEISLPAQIEGQANPNQTWTGDEFFPLTNTDYFSTVGNLQPELQFNKNQTLGIIFTVEDTLAFGGGPILWSNINAGFSKGWEVCVSGGILEVRQISGAGLSQAQFSGVPGYGLCCCFATIVDDGANGQIRAVLFDGGTRTATVTIANPIQVPDATCSHRLGGPIIIGGNGWLPGGILGIIKLDRAATDAELRQWAQNVRPSLPNVNRYEFPQDVIDDLQKQFHCYARDWDATGVMQTTGGPAGIGFDFTTVGSPSKVSKAETIFRRLGPLFLDTEPAVYDTRGGPHTDPVARIAFTTDARTQEICVGFRSDNPDNVDNGFLVVNVDGILNPFPGSNPPDSFAKADDVTRYAWFSIIGASTAIAAHNVEIIVPDRLHYDGRSLYKSGTFVESVTTSQFQTFGTAATSRRLVLVGDDDVIGHDAGGTNEPVTSWLRADYPGRVTAHAATTRGFSTLLNTFGGDLNPWSRGIVEAGEEGGPTAVDVWITLGFQDYARNSLTPTAFAAAYGNLVDQIHALRATWTIYAQKMIQAFFDAVANAGGFTLAQFNTAIDGLTSGRAWLHVVNARVPNAISFTSTHIHPDQPAGATAWKGNIKLLIGY